MSFQTRWSSPSNIAIIKYWGKFGRQFPCNPSISFTLNKSKSIFEVSVLESNSLAVNYTFENENNDKFKARIEKILKAWCDFEPEIATLSFNISSSNTFPHSSGIASSASSMSALALATLDILYQKKNLDIDREFYKKASFLARLASGSASRSVYGEFNLWGETELMNNSSNEEAIPISFHENFKHIQDSILIVSSDEKEISSSLGHELMNSNYFAQTRFDQARENTRDLLNALETGDFDHFGTIAEAEARSLHALMLTSEPWFFLLKENSLNIMAKVREYRQKTQRPLYFTIDAGPNIHLIYPPDNEIKSFIDSELIQYTENNKIIHDEIGLGPEKLS